MTLIEDTAGEVAGVFGGIGRWGGAIVVDFPPVQSGHVRRIAVILRHCVFVDGLKEFPRLTMFAPVKGQQKAIESRRMGGAGGGGNGNALKVAGLVKAGGEQGRGGGIGGWGTGFIDGGRGASGNRTRTVVSSPYLRANFGPYGGDGGGQVGLAIYGLIGGIQIGNQGIGSGGFLVAGDALGDSLQGDLQIHFADSAGDGDVVENQGRDFDQAVAVDAVLADNVFPAIVLDVSEGDGGYSWVERYGIVGGVVLDGVETGGVVVNDAADAFGESFHFRPGFISFLQGDLLLVQFGQNRCQSSRHAGGDNDGDHGETSNICENPFWRHICRLYCFWHEIYRNWKNFSQLCVCCDGENLLFITTIVGRVFVGIILELYFKGRLMMRALFLILSILLPSGAFSVEKGIWKIHQVDVVDDAVRGAELYKSVFVQLKKLRRALKKANMFQRVRFTLLEDRIKDFNIEGTTEILNEYQNSGGKGVDKIIRKIRRKISIFVKNHQNNTPAVLEGISWSPAGSGNVGTPLVLDAVAGVQNGDTVTYTRVSGDCSFGTGSEVSGRTLTFAAEGTCVVKAGVVRSGYNPWDSGNVSVSVGLGILTGIGWTPASGGNVGTPLVLDAVAGVQNGDTVTYTRVSGDCSFGTGSEVSGRTLTFAAEGTCVVKAGVARSGYNPWDSGNKSIAVSAAPVVSGISWAPASGGRVGAPLVLDAVAGVQNGDTVTYIVVSGYCSFDSGSEIAGRTLTFAAPGSCVVKAGVARSGHTSWDSGNRSIVVDPGIISNVVWAPATSGQVGTPLVLDAVTGNHYGDIVLYEKVSGSCRFGREKRELSLRTLTFTAAGTCVVKARVKRLGYVSWDSGNVSIAVSPAPLLGGISWTQTVTNGTVGSPFVLSAVTGTQDGDTVTYTKVSGSCTFNSGSEMDRRTLNFFVEEVCVIRVMVERVGYTPWISADVSITASGVAMVSLPCGGSVPGGMRFFSTQKAFALLQQNGSVVTWGHPNYGGNSSGVPTGSLDSGVVQIFTTGSAFAALKSDGTVVTWGNADSGGDSSSVSGGTLNSGVKVCRIVGSHKAFAALKEDGSVVSWGSSLHGGNLSVMKWYYRVPTWEAFPLHSSLYGSGVAKIVASGSAFAALKDDGSIFTWGNENEGGDGVVHGSVLVYDIRPTLRQGGFVEIYSNDHAFSAIKEKTVDGQKIRSALSWGNIHYGGKAPSKELSSGVSKIFSNQRAFAALMENGSVVAWGDHGRGGTIGSITDDLQSGVVDIVSNKFTFVALKNDGSLVSWGELYDGGRTHMNAFSTLTLTGSVEKIISNNYAFAVLQSNGSVAVWGDRRGGGDISSMGSTLDTGVVDLASTEDTFAAHKSDGSVVVWGSSYGALPQSIIDTTCLASGVIRLASSNDKAYVAVKDDGTLVTWGDYAAGGHLYHGGNGNQLEKCDLSLEELDELL